MPGPLDSKKASSRLNRYSQLYEVGGSHSIRVSCLTLTSGDGGDIQVGTVGMEIRLSVKFHPVRLLPEIILLIGLPKICSSGAASGGWWSEAHSGIAGMRAN